MEEKILIVEDEFIVAHDLRMILERAGYSVVGIADSVKTAKSILEENEVDLILLDIYLKGRLTGIDLAQELMAQHIPFIYISANSNEKVLEAAKSTSPYGFIIKPYREKDVLMAIDIARYRWQHNLNMKVSGERFMQDFILDISMKSLGWQKKMLATASAFQPYIPFDFIALSGISKDGHRYGEIGILRKNFDQYSLFTADEFIRDNGMSRHRYDELNQLVTATTENAIYIGEDFANVKKIAPMKKLMAETYQMAANMVKTFHLENGDQLSFSFYSRTVDIYQQAHMALLNALTPTLEKQLAHMVEMQRSDTPASTSMSSRQAYPTIKNPFDKIIGQSNEILSVLDKVQIVAPTDTAVLIMGESGTGKEEIARSLHRLSKRSGQALVAINCAALPAELIESILFGHEKGAFTGATHTKIGKFEEANGGTIFLDEIGEMPFELQAKLLRTLQEKEIDRLGGRNTIPIDVRIIAATNVNLEKEIAKGRFRLDLYYRLNVFAIQVPALRERKSDIPLLAEHFAKLHSTQLGKQSPTISSAYIHRLFQHDWPGNIRELENAIVRSLILSKDDHLDPSLLDLDGEGTPNSSTGEIKSIADNEKDHIIRVLALCKGRVAGEGGAADLLGIPVTTLNSKIKKWDIKRMPNTNHM